jgi:hypothetical protein
VRRALAIALAAPWMFAGCSSAPANLHDAIQQLTQIYCEAEFRCCSAAQATAKSGVADASHCSMSVLPSLVQLGAAAQAQVDKGLYTYSPGAAAICVDSIRGALSSCSGTAFQTDFGANPFCTAAFTGTLQPGAACDAANFGGGCGTGSYCALGTCKLYAKSGESCVATACGPGLTCLMSGKCGAPLDDAQPCNAGPQCKSNTCTAGACAPTPTVAQKICN